MLFNPRSYGALFQIDRSVRLKLSGLCSAIRLRQCTESRGNYITMQDTFMISNVPQFYGLTACPSIHEYHWFILARLGYVG